MRGEVCDDENHPDVYLFITCKYVGVDFIPKKCGLVLYMCRPCPCYTALGDYIRCTIHIYKTCTCNHHTSLLWRKVGVSGETPPPSGQFLGTAHMGFEFAIQRWKACVKTSKPLGPLIANISHMQLNLPIKTPVVFELSRVDKTAS